MGLLAAAHACLCDELTVRFKAPVHAQQFVVVTCYATAEVRQIYCRQKGALTQRKFANRWAGVLPVLLPLELSPNCTSLTQTRVIKRNCVWQCQIHITPLTCFDHLRGHRQEKFVFFVVMWCGVTLVQVGVWWFLCRIIWHQRKEQEGEVDHKAQSRGCWNFLHFPEENRGNI